VLPARHFGLTARGTIEAGMRADLVLIAGDPIADISATRQIQQVWCAGVERFEYP
jgi:imidazolonepropionase-like amidohydrolase